MLRLKTLGSPVVEGSRGPLPGTAGQPKALALLALLAVAYERGLSRDRLVGYLWPDVPPKTAAHRLNQLLYALRRDLGSNDLFLGSSALRLNPDMVATDLADFAAALRRGELEQAMALYGGPFLDGFYLDEAPEFERWMEQERARLTKGYVSALETVASQAAGRTDLAAAVEWRRKLAQVDPLDSGAALRLVEVLNAAGSPGAALQVARVHQALRRQELDAAPDPAIAALVAQIRGPAPAHVPAVPAGPLRRHATTAVAVLPFVNMSPEPDNEYFSEGMSEALSNALAKIDGLHVASRTSACSFKDKREDVREIGQRLGVGALLEGSVQRAGTRLRITAQLIGTENGYQLWSAVYDRKLADVFDIQDELARAIVDALKLRLAGSGEEPVVQPGTKDLTAYTEYLRGQYWSSKRTPEGLRRAVKCYVSACTGDPAYALAYAGLAQTYHLLAIYGVEHPRDVYPMARVAARRAIELNESLAEAHVAAGCVALCYDWDWPRAEREFRRAIELNDNHAQAHHWLAWCMLIRGSTDDAVAVVRRAMELEPLSPIIHARGGQILAYANRNAESEAASLRALELDPSFGVAFETLSTTYTRREAGRYQEAAETLSRDAGAPGSVARYFLPWVHALMGHYDEAWRLLSELDLDPVNGRSPPTYSVQWLVAVHAALGDSEGAFRWLQRAVVDRVFSPTLPNVEEEFAPLRSDPRFATFQAAVGLPR
jgi:adenylate cyclase